MNKRTKILTGIAGAALLAFVSVAIHEHSASRAATLQAIETTRVGTDCRISLNIDGTCGYQISRSGSHTLVVGLEGARAGNLLKMTQQYSGGLFQGYRVISTNSADGSPELVIQIQTRTSVGFSIQNEGPSLGLVMKPLDLTVDPLPLDSAYAANAVALLLPMKRFVAARAVPSIQITLSSVQIRRMANGCTLVSLNTSGPVEFKALQLSHPARLVIDLENAGIATSQDFYTASGTLVKEIHVDKHQANGRLVARVVADLAGTPAVNIHSGPTGVQIELTPPQPSTVSALAPAGTALDKAKREYEKQTLAMLMRPVKVSLDDGSSVVKAPKTNPVDPADSAPQPVAQKAKPLAGQRTRVVASQPRLAEAPLEFADTLPVRTDWANVDSAPYVDPPSLFPTALAAMKAAQVVAGQGTPAASPVANPAAHAKTQAPSRYTGELISLNLKDVDLKDFFRLIHEISGLNVVVDSNVSGTVTLVLDDVPWDEALEIVLKNNALGKQLEGNVLRIAKVSTLTAEEENNTKLQEAQQLSAPLIQVYRPLRYASAIDVKPAPVQIQGLAPPQNIPGVVSIIKSFAPGSVLSERGSVVADPRNNAVIVTDVPTQIPVIETMIDKLDQKPKQISIEARIVQANADFSRQLSSVLAAAFNNKSAGTAAATGTNILSVAPPQSPLPGLTAALQPLSVGNTGFGAFAITDATARYAISAALSAAETRDQAKVISRPTIVTQNNVVGEVQQGVQIPIQTSINNTVTTQFVNATLQLAVIPQVTQGGQIFLNIVVNNASVGAVLSFAGPSINTQQATTQVLVPDGGTVVFGGITVTNRNRSATYVPLLGSIPIIGNLFKSSAVNTNDQELLF
ncbi:MAG: type IV pilus secretin PilQ, partial [Terriglobia bacterium]